MQRGSLRFVRTTHLKEMIGKRGRVRYVAVGDGENGGSVLNHQASTSDELSRVAYLERENARLHRLVAELLVKNEQLRQLYLASLTVEGKDGAIIGPT